MIRPEELRLGNAIYQNGDLSRIVQLEIRYKTKYRINDMEIDLSDIDKIFTGVPITEEWLITAGFKENPTFGEGTYGNGKIGIYFDKRSNEIVLLHMRIKYLHLFQNWYFFNEGEELTFQ